MSKVLVIEMWKPIPDFPGYEVSDGGQVRSFKRRQPKLLAVRTRHDRKRDVHLCTDGILHRMLVHRLVLIAFVGPCPVGYEALHRNGNGLDNTLPNLHWGTRSENLYDQTRLGEKDIRGARNPNYRHGRCCGRQRREYMRKWRQQKSKEVA